MVRSIIMLAACAALFSGCAGSSGATGPRGWTQEHEGLWDNPHAPHDYFTAASSPYDGTLKDLASQTTTDMVLTNKAKLVSAAPLPQCPALAGLQVFTLRGGFRAKVAFAVRDGKRIQAQYIRPAPEPDDPAAIDALAANVCALP
jgi:hypothetical protein